MWKKQPRAISQKKRSTVLLKIFEKYSKGVHFLIKLPTEGLQLF